MIVTIYASDYAPVSHEINGKELAYILAEKDKSRFVVNPKNLELITDSLDRLGEAYVIEYDQ